MATTKDLPDTDDEKVESMSAESLEFLEQVRKGKARNFVMSVKGNKVRALLVKKKKVKERERKEMRGQGYQPVFGVVSGMGAKLTFSIARSDGFDEAPGRGKVEKLKKFLTEQTGKPFKPTWEVVATPPPIPFDEDDLQNPLVAKFMKLEPLITKAADTRPDRADELQQRVAQIREMLQDAEAISAADPEVNDLIGFLKELLAGSTAASATGDTASQDTEATAGKLAEALKRLKPLVDRAIDADPNQKAELHGTMARIAGEIKDRQFDAAKQGLISFAGLLKSLVARQPATATDETAVQLQQFSERLTVLRPRLLEAQQKDRERATKLGAVWDYARQQSEAGNFKNAFQALDRLEVAIKQVMGDAATHTDVIPEGAAATGMTPLQIEQVCREWTDKAALTLESIRDLEAEVRMSGYEDLEPFADALDDLVDGFPGEIAETLVALAAAAQSKSEEDIKKYQSRARKQVKSCAAYIKENEQLIAACEEHPFEAGRVQIRRPLSQSLKGLAQLLQ